MNFDNFKGFELPAMKTETWCSPIEVIFENGDRLVCETTVRSYHDWRDTPIGPVDFGRCYMSSRQFIERPATEVKE